MNVQSAPRVIKESLAIWRLKRMKKFPDLNSTQILTGMPRGGTTWLTEFFLQRPDTLYIHEPLSLFRLKTYSNLTIDWHQFIPKNETWPEMKEVLKELFQAQCINRSLIINTRNKNHLAQTSSIFVKFVRLNRMLPWVVREFPELPKPIYIIRHPGAVVYSQMNHGSWSKKNFKSYDRYRSGRFDEYYQPIMSKTGRIKSFAEHLALEWVLDTLPLFHPDNGTAWETFSYEELLQNKNGSHERLLKIIPNFSYDLDRLKRPSFSVADANPLSQNKVSQLSKWKEGLTNEQKKGIQRILKAADFSCYDLETIEPKYDELKAGNRSSILEAFHA